MNEWFTTLLQTLQTTDVSILLAINHAHTPFWDAVMWLVSEKWVWLPFYVSLLFVVWKNYSWKACCVVFVSIGLLLLLTDFYTSHFLRPEMARLRPCNLANPLSASIHIIDGYRSGPYGFPSSHAGNAWALVFVMAYFLRSRRIVGFLVFWAIAMCYSRMYLGVHYFSDLLGGFSLAFLGGGIMALVLRKHHIVCPTHQLQGLKVPLFVGGATFLILFVAAIFYRP